MVCVGPPLLAPATQLLELQSVLWVQLAPAFVPPTQSPVGSSSGFVLQNEVPVVVAQWAPVKPHVVPSSMLCPPSVTLPKSTPQFPPEVLLARMLLVTVVAALPLMAPPPKELPLLPENVLLLTVRLPPLSMAPAKLALLPEKVLLLTLIVPTLAMAPLLALGALLPEKVQLLTVRVPLLKIAPPSSGACPLAIVR